MTLYYIKPLKGVLCFESAEFEPDVPKQPFGIVAVDRFAVEPGNIDTRLEVILHNHRELSVLHLSAWDAAMVISLCYQIGVLHDEPAGRPLPARFVNLFHCDPVQGLKSLIRTTFPSLRAVGENAAYRSMQIASRPDDWAVLHRQDRLDQRAAALTAYADRTGLPEANRLAAQARLDAATARQGG